MIIKKEYVLQFWKEQTHLYQRRIEEDFKGHRGRHVRGPFVRITTSIQERFKSCIVPIKPVWRRHYEWAWMQNSYICANGSMTLHKIKAHNTATLYITEMLRNLDQEFKLGKTK